MLKSYEERICCDTIMILIVDENPIWRCPVCNKIEPTPTSD